MAGGNPKLVVTILANTAELIKNLEAGRGAIEAYGPTVAKMQDAWARNGAAMIQQAALITAALKGIEIGTLTASDAAKNLKQLEAGMAQMARAGQPIPPLLQETAAQLRAVVAATQQAGAPTEALGVSFSKLVASYVTAQSILAAATSAFNALTGEIVASIKAAGDAEKAHAQMTAALRTQGTAVPSVIQAYLGYADALQKTTIYQDDAIEGAEALLVQVGNVMPAEMKKALAATTELASGLGKDLNEAALLVSKAAEGNVGALKKAGITIDETRAKSEGFGYVLDQITAKFGGQAAALAGTYQGRIAQLGNTWNNVEESIGRVITQNATVLNALDRLTTHIADNTHELSDNQRAANFVSDSVILLIRGIGALGPLLALADTALAGLVVGWMGVYNGAISFAAALDAGAIRVLRYLEVIARMQGQHISFANEIKFFTDDFNELNARYERNAQTGGALWDMSQKIAAGFKGAGAFADQLAKDLENTRGKTVALTDSANEDAAAWERHTKAVEDAKVAQQAMADDAKAALDEWQETIRRHKEEQKKAEEEVTAFLDQMDADRLADAKAALDEWAETVKRHQQEYKDAEQEVTDFLAQQDADRLMDAKAELDDWSETVKRHQKDQKDADEQIDRDLKDRAAAFDNSLRDLTQAFSFLSQISGDSFGGIVKDIGTMISAIQTAESVLKSMSDLMKQMGHAGGLSPTATRYANTAIVGAAAGSEVAQLSGTRSGAVGAGEGAAGGAATGALYGSVVPGVGTALGAGIGAIAGAISGYFAARKAAAELREANVAATKSVQDMVAQLHEQYGTTAQILALQKAVGVSVVGDNGLSGEQGLGGLAHAQAAVTEFQKRVAALQAAVEEFGLTWRDLLKPGQTDAINSEIDDFATKWETLRTAGYDLNKVTEKGAGSLLALLQDAADAGVDVSSSLAEPIRLLGQMGITSDANAAALNAYLGHALAAGQKIPSALEPVLEQLIRMGKLTQENARAMLGLGADTGPSFDQVKAAADKYGLSLDKLGPKVGQLDINEQAKQMVDDWNTLAGAGADVGAVMDGMKDKAQAVVTEALKFGDQIPESMKPMLQAMVDAGDLTDDTGAKLTDLSKLSFAKDMTQQIGDLVSVLKQMFGIVEDPDGNFEKLANQGQDAAKKIAGDSGVGLVTDKLAGTGGLTDTLSSQQQDWVNWQAAATSAADDIGRHIMSIPTDVTVAISYTTSGMPAPPTTVAAARGALITPDMVRHWAGGSGWVSPWVPQGTDTVPAMLTPGERVLSVADTKAYDATTGGAFRPGQVVGGDLHVHIHGQFVDATGLDRMAPRIAEVVFKEVQYGRGGGLKTKARVALGV